MSDISRFCEDGDLDGVKRSIKEHGLNVETRIGHGWTPLMVVCKNGYLEIAKYLIEECNANIEGRSIFGGWTPLMFACRSGHLEIVKYLVEHHGVDVEVKEGVIDEKNALIYACQYDHLEITKYLVEQCNANVEVCDRNGVTPLMYACWYGHLEIVKYLVEECDANVFVETEREERASDITFSIQIKKYLREVEEIAMMKKHP